MVKKDNVRLVVTLTKKEFALLEDASCESGLSKSVIVKIALLEKLEKLHELSKVLH